MRGGGGGGGGGGGRMGKGSWAGDEESLKAANPGQLLKKFGDFFRPFHRWIALSVALSLALAAVDLAGPQIIRMILDGPVREHDLTGIRNLTLLYLATIIGSFLFEALLTLVVNWTGQSAMLMMRSRIFRHLQSLDTRFFDHQPVGRLLTRVMNDVNALNEALTTGIPMIFRDLFFLAGIIIMLFYTDWRLALWVFVCFPAILIVGWRFSRVMRKYYRQTRARLAAMNAFLQENLSGMRIVQLFVQEHRMQKKFVDLNARYRDSQLGTVFAFSMIFPAIEIVTAVALAIILWRGGLRLQSQTIEYGVLFAFLLYVRKFFHPIRDLAEKFNTFEASMAAAERIFELLDMKPQLVDAPQTAPLPAFHSRIEFDHVWFAYEGEDWILRDVSFTVEHGETVAIVGSTGAGKTTIINLLQRFYDVQKGAIRIDGLDIREVSQQELRRRFAVVLQDVFLFSGTVADNIRLGRPDLSDGEVQKAAQTVHADSFIERFEDRYDHKILERGATLSVGQKQLLAFARAMACQPNILILDEATSNIDTHTELLIQDALHRLLQDRTAIVIAHRLSTIKRAQKILVMHHGKLREQGTHDELIRNGGIYARLCQLQYKEELVSPADVASGEATD